MKRIGKGHLIVKDRVRIAYYSELTRPVQHAVRMLKRDFAAVMGKDFQWEERRTSLASGHDAGAELHIRYAGEQDREINRPEAFGFRFAFDENGIPVAMHIVGYDDLGLVYGLLEFSRAFLGIEPFWYWMDQTMQLKDEIAIPGDNFDSPVSKVRFRGWFVNDEVCLIGWKETYPPSPEVWEPAFEALLRCGGNMVIPGTDLPRHGIHYELASEMGLWVTHHHAEPLGAEMFLRAYPGKQASYQEHPDLFEALWREAIEEQKDKNVLWVLSFRGQGDQPFWEQDPSFDTPEKRGALIAKVIRKQYEMISESVQHPICSVALYGEIAELYKGGYIQLPDDVIRIWADNGYGKMVSRRHGHLNLRIPALPAADGRNHGIYYHVTFHDLQASNHLTMFPGPAGFLKSEVEGAFAAGAHEYVLVNCGNIRQHVYPLDILRELWHKGEMDEERHLKQFVRSYFSEAQDEVAALYRSYAAAAIPYGPNVDDWAGDEYYHHPARQIIGHWMTGAGEATDVRLRWAVGDVPFPDQVKRFEERLLDGIRTWRQWLDRCDALIAKLDSDNAEKVRDHLRFHGALHLSGCEGFYALCIAYEAFRKGEHPQAFVHASRSLRAYRRSLDALRNAEHGKWERFYRGDWLTNVESTVSNVDTLRRFIRMHGDSPDFFLWYKAYLMPETEKYIYLENTHRNPLSDDELAMRLEEKWRQTFPSDRI